MAPDHRFSTSIDRRASTRHSFQSSIYEEMDNDEFGMEAMGISDGFRPMDRPTSQERASFRTSQNGYPSARRLTPPPRPSSTTKPNYTDNFALRHDGPASTPTPMRPALIAASSSTSTITRASSVSTEATIIRPESPYRGPTGPSHPYQIYPQNTRPARTASIATTSTYQPPADRGYNGPNGPTHPYGMYPQNTVTESEPLVLASSIPVGFPGHGADYQRRLGPDGEEAADLIGPNGHTEQLPPYSRYPNEAFSRKAGGIAPLAVGAGGIGLATRNPEFESVDDLRPTPSRQSTRTLTSEVSDAHINSTGAPMSEKPEEKKWKRIAQRKLWGFVPIWTLVLAGVVLLLFCIILASVLAALKPRPPLNYVPHQADPDQGPATVTTTVDATQVASLPSGLPALPTGVWAFQIPVPETSRPNCIDRTLEYPAWSCSVSSFNMLKMTVGQNGRSNVSNHEVLIEEVNDGPPGFSYGAQTPIIASKHSLSLVSNNDDSSRFGMAWFFQAPYDKLVIVAESALIPNSKRGTYRPSIFDFKRKGVAQPGEKPWFCFWNETLLETFIYPNSSSQAGVLAQSLASAQAWPTLTTVVINSKPIAVATETSTRTTLSTAIVTTPAAALITPPSYIMGGLPLYPKVVKILERRLPVSPRPYCVQMVVSPDGMSVSNYYNSSNIQPAVNIEETLPKYSGSTVKRSDLNPIEAREIELEERQSSESCSCVWRSI